MENENEQGPGAANPELIALAGRIGNGSADAPGGGDPAGGAAGGRAGTDEAQQGAQLLGIARTLVSAVCRAVESRWPAAVYSEEEKMMMAGVLVPVWLKHVKSPWFAQWQEELTAAGVALYMGYTGWDRVRASKAEASKVPAGDRAAAPGVVM